METFSASLALCVGNSPATGEFPEQMASNAENVSIWWAHHERGARTINGILILASALLPQRQDRAKTGKFKLSISNKYCVIGFENPNVHRRWLAWTLTILLRWFCEGLVYSCRALKIRWKVAGEHIQQFSSTRAFVVTGGPHSIYVDPHSSAFLP